MHQTSVKKLYSVQLFINNTFAERLQTETAKRYRNQRMSVVTADRQVPGPISYDRCEEPGPSLSRRYRSPHEMKCFFVLLMQIKPKVKSYLLYKPFGSCQLL